jgi:hypothetical protein
VRVKTDTTGGQAFPHLHIAACEGMTLRDYFAAQALKGMLSGADPSRASKPDCIRTITVAAEAAYLAADAMLKERAQ